MRRRLPLQASMVLAALCALAGVAGAQRIQMPVGFRFTWIGARWQADAKVVDSRTGRPIAATLSYRVADPTVASVTARGEVTARKPGNTRLWAVSGRDSASALIVVEPWPAHFSFSPSAVRFDALRTSQVLRVQASDSAGVPIAGSTTRAGACRAVNERVARLSRDTIVAVGNGSTWIRCSDRGIADSIRVDIQQRATSVQITNKPTLSRQRAPGDTFTVRYTVRDRNNEQVPDARPTWASLNPYVVSVDPLTGRGRAVGGGDTRVIMQVGDVADSVSFIVSGASAAPVVAVAAPTDTTASRSKATLIVDEIFAYEAETTFVNITVLDSAGAPVRLSDLTFRMVDTSIASRVDTTRILGKKSGQGSLIVRYGSMVDTAIVNVRPRPTGSSSSAAADNESRAAAFRAPTIPDSSAQHRQTRANADLIIHTDPALGARRQNLVIFGNAIGSFAELWSRGSDGTVEDRTGPLYGGTGTILLYQKLELSGTMKLGTLTSVDTVGEPLKVLEAEGSAGFFPVRQLGLRAGVILRGKKTELATQTARIPKVSLVSRFSFIGDIFNTYAAFSLLPKATFKRIDEQGSLFSRGGEAGVEFRLARANGINGGLTYYVEQITFDESNRVEGFSAIRLRFGFNIGR